MTSHENKWKCIMICRYKDFMCECPEGVLRKEVRITKLFFSLSSVLLKCLICRSNTLYNILSFEVYLGFFDVAVDHQCRCCCRARFLKSVAWRGRSRKQCEIENWCQQKTNIKSYMLSSNTLNIQPSLNLKKKWQLYTFGLTAFIKMSDMEIRKVSRMIVDC